jgi:uncharacterized protein YjiS (DUF1127 family)
MGRRERFIPGKAGKLFGPCREAPMRTTFDTRTAGIAAAPILGSPRNPVPLAERIASWLRSRIAVRRSLTSELLVGQLDTHMLRDIGLRANQLPRLRPDRALLVMHGGGAFL